MPCLNYHIGRSAAPCIGAVTKEDYDGIIADVIAFLEGRVDGLIRERRRTQMQEAAREMDFERAAKLRDELAALSHVRDRQQATIASEDSFDAVGAFAEGESACVQVFAVRDGQVVNRDSFLLDNYGESRAEDVAPAVRSPVLRQRRRPPRGPGPVRRRTTSSSPLATTSRSCAARGSRCAARSAATSGACWRSP